MDTGFKIGVCKERKNQFRAEITSFSYLSGILVAAT